MATYTASTYLLNPKQVHAGNQSRHFVFNGQMVSAGDATYLAKIPNGATILDCWARYGTPTHTTGGGVSFCICKGRTASATSTLGVLGTLSASTATQQHFNMRGNNLAFAPFKVSLSDDDAVQYATFRMQLLTAPASLTGSGTFSIDGMIVWAMDSEG